MLFMTRLVLLAIFAISMINGARADQAPQIRLTLLQGTPVTTADITSATSVCLEPYNSAHNQLSTYDGTNWVSMDVAPSTYCLSASGLSVNTNYDILVSNSGGIPSLSWSSAYVNDTTPPARAKQDGVDVLASDHTKRIIGAVHVGSIAGQLEDSHTHRWLSNYYNPQPRDMWVQDPTPTWTYSIGTAYQQARANPANQLDYIVVVPRLIGAHVQAAVISSAGAGAMVGIGLNGSLGNVAQINQQASIPASLASNSFQTSADYIGTPGIGRNTVLWLEHGFGSGTTQTWLGYVPPWQISGITGWVLN
jgi:hypothetical protein